MPDLIPLSFEELGDECVAVAYAVAEFPFLEDDMVASNRIDAIIARAYHLSRSEAAAYLTAEKVFINGRCITNCNQSCDNGDIVSVRQKGRFVFETDQSLSKKGKLRVRFMIYK